MILLAILLIGIILVIRQRDAFFGLPLNLADEAQLILGIFLIVFTIIFFLSICFIPSELEALKAEQESLPALRESLQELREHRNSVAEDSEYILKAQDYRERVVIYNQRVKFWKEFLKKHPNFVSSSWVLPRYVRNKIMESVPKLQLLSP